MNVAGLALAAVLALMPTASLAQRPPKVQRVGLLMQTSPAVAAHLGRAFTQGLRDLGRIEGKDVLVEYRWAEGKPERLPQLVAELVAAKVDLIVASGNAAAEAAHRATTTIPIVMVTVADPVESGLVRSLARPGGNVTGLSAQLTRDIRAKQIQLLKEAVSGLARVVILRRTAVADAAVWKQYEEAGRTLDVRIQFANVAGIDDLPRAIGALPRERTALLLPGDPLFFAARQRLVALTLEHRLPMMSNAREVTQAGGLMSYSARLTDQFRRAAVYADKVLKGASPATLPIEQPTEFELAINLNTAKVLKLTLPQTLLVRAAEIIQ